MSVGINVFAPRHQLSLVSTLGFHAQNVYPIFFRATLSLAADTTSLTSMGIRNTACSLGDWCYDRGYAFIFLAASFRVRYTNISSGERKKEMGAPLLL